MEEKRRDRHGKDIGSLLFGLWTHRNDGQSRCRRAREAGAQVDIKRVPDLVPDEIARKSYYKLDQAAPIASDEELANYDAIIVGVGTRFDRMASQMANFLDRAGKLRTHGALVGKVGRAPAKTRVPWRAICCRRGIKSSCPTPAAQKRWPKRLPTSGPARRREPATMCSGAPKPALRELPRLGLDGRDWRINCQTHTQAG